MNGNRTTQRSVMLILVMVAILATAIYLGVQKTRRDQVVDQGTLSDVAVVEPAQDNCGLTVESPLPGSTVGHSFSISGTLDMNPKLNCRWIVFEGQAGYIEIRDGSGTVITPVVPISLSDTWMDTALQGGVIHFSVPVTIPNTANGPISLMMIEDDPSGESPVINTLMLSVVVQ